MDFESAADSLAKLDDKGLGRISELVRQMNAAEEYVTHCEETLDAAQRNLRRIQQELLPEELKKYGVSEVTMLDGSKVVVTTEYNPSVPEENREAFYDWLKEIGHGGLVKNVVSVALGRDSDNEQKHLLGLLEDNGFVAEQKKKVEPMTLKAWVKEQKGLGTEFPAEIITVFEISKAKIKKPKKAKAKK